MNSNIVYLPGWCLGRGPWQASVTALGGRIIDLPGYGLAPLLDDFNVAADALAEQLPVGAILCGWSLGAMLALAIAARHPTKVARLALVAGTASFVQRPDWPHGMPPEVLAEFTAAVAEDIEAMLPRFVGGFNRGDAHNKAVTRQLLDMADPRPPGRTLATGLSWLRDVDLRQAAPRVTAPTLLCHGANDPLMPIAAAQALAGLIPGARLESFADCAHAPFASNPQDFHARLKSFLNDPAS